jgi:tetratricopeptide (TPR) repeat protein
MNSERFRVVERLFQGAADLPQEERASFLDRCCGDDGTRHQVDIMLKGLDEGTAHLLEVASTAACDLGELAPGVVIDGRYKLLRVLGEGGLGVVWLADQHEPVRRKVALKVIKLGMDTNQVVARFEAERNALGLMSHPHIASIHDAGVAEKGRPYFVMEYVEGVPISAFCDEEQLSISERLELFTVVCHAVHHAHQKGIIHRDLKPSNLLVCMHEGEPVPKVIDFGIAKATNRELTERTLYTSVGEFIGTPEYMSPEQAELSGVGVDSTTDIYALGVILYELLTGTLPFDAETLRRGGLDGLQRILRDEDPERPSTRLSTIGERTSTIGKQRRMDARSLLRQLRGDLDWIVMKAMAKERTRRYASASELAQDVGRYLRGEAIEARPPSAAYRVRTLARRHKVAFAVAVMLLVAVPVLAAATVVAATAAVRARAAQREAEASRLRAEAVTDLVTDALVSSNPYRGGTDTLLVTAAMEQVIEKLDAGALEDQPETEAALRQTISEVLAGNWRVPEAVQQAERALEINRDLYPGDHPEVAHSLNVVALRLDQASRSTEAVDRFQSALEMRRRLFPGDHLSVAGALNNFASGLDKVGRTAEALPLYRAALRMKQRLIAGDHRELVGARMNVAGCLSKLGREEEALARYHEALEMSRRLFEDADHVLVATIQIAMGRCLHSLGRPAEALMHHEEALEMRRRLVDADSYELGWPLNNLAWCLESLGRADEALPMHEQALEMRRRHTTDDTYGVATGLKHLARCLHALDRTEEALRNYQEALEMIRRLLQVDDHDVAGCLSGVASCLESLGRSEEALPRYEEAIQICRRLLPPGHPEALRPQIGMARTLVSLGEYVEAEALLLDAAGHCERSDVARWWHGRTVAEGAVRLYEAWHAAEPDEGYDVEAGEWRATGEHVDGDGTERD